MKDNNICVNGIESCSRKDNTVSSSSGVPWFRYRPRDRLYRLRLFVVSFNQSIKKTIGAVYTVETKDKRKEILEQQVTVSIVITFTVCIETTGNLIRLM
jgi:hypothetical protein